MRTETTPHPGKGNAVVGRPLEQTQAFPFPIVALAERRRRPLSGGGGRVVEGGRLRTVHKSGGSWVDTGEELGRCPLGLGTLTGQCGCRLSSTDLTVGFPPNTRRSAHGPVGDVG
jgi:hypothetical protein